MSPSSLEVRQHEHERTGEMVSSRFCLCDLHIHIFTLFSSFTRNQAITLSLRACPLQQDSPARVCLLKVLPHETVMCMLVCRSEGSG